MMLVLNRNTETPELFHRRSRLPRRAPLLAWPGTMALINLRKLISKAPTMLRQQGGLSWNWALLGYPGARLTKSL
jgi:hypothetical protein